MGKSLVTSRAPLAAVQISVIKSSGSVSGIGGFKESHSLLYLRLPIPTLRVLRDNGMKTVHWYVPNGTTSAGAGTGTGTSQSHPRTLNMR